MTSEEKRADQMTPGQNAAQTPDYTTELMQDLTAERPYWWFDLAQEQDLRDALRMMLDGPSQERASRVRTLLRARVLDRISFATRVGYYFRMKDEAKAKPEGSSDVREA